MTSGPHGPGPGEAVPLRHILPAGALTRASDGATQGGETP